MPGSPAASPDPGRWLPLLRAHARLLDAASARVRVTTVTPREAIRRQYAESLEILRIARLAGEPAEAADVGSGGGFPGLVFAAVDPAMPVHLVEPLQKRAALLREAALALGLDNVQVHAVRAEEAARGPLRDRCGMVTARAVAELRELLEYTAPLATPGGTIVLPKGSARDAEVREAGAALAALACEVEAVHPMRPEISDAISVVVIRKIAHTPERYPRRAGMAKKRPL